MIRVSARVRVDSSVSTALRHRRVLGFQRLRAWPACPPVMLADADRQHGFEALPGTIFAGRRFADNLHYVK